MFDFLKNIMGKKEPEMRDIAFDIIPAWLDEYEKKSLEILNSATEEPVRNIRNAAAQLQLMVNNIADAEDDPVLHPKIKSIAKNSLPLFVKAMNSSLAKELPDDREEFYLAAVECVKGCINSMRGQGRYLQMVFPEEMKTVKTGIDTMGREINALTQALSTYRNARAVSSAVRSLHASLVAMNEDLARSVDKDTRTDRRISDLSARIEAIDKELAGLKEDAGNREVEEQKSALQELESSRDDAIRHYAALSMTASHVFRKAEKISQKQHNKPETDALRRVMELLSDHTIPPETDLSETLSRACPVAERMIEAMEIPLKNKEERAVFSDTAAFCRDICAAGNTVRKLEESCRAAEESLALHPFVSRMRSLEREKTQQQAMLVKERENKNELAEWRKKTEEQIPVLREGLARKAEIIAGPGMKIRITGA
nr:hypothetical protein [uncultured Methanoregula sp.]